MLGVGQEGALQWAAWLCCPQAFTCHQAESWMGAAGVADTQKFSNKTSHSSEPVVWHESRQVSPQCCDS